MTKIRHAARLLAAVSAVAAVASPAAAQQVDRIVAFGDSYADTGIARSTILADPLASATPPSGIKYLVGTFYPTGRFSGGTNYIDTLSDILNAPVENYAVGGALATGFPVPFPPGTSYNTNCGPGVGGGSPAMCPLGLQYEVDQFLNVGVQNGLFPTGTATFDEGDLVTVSIGGNDARYYQQNYSALPVQPFISASIAGATAQLDRLVAAGAPTISFLAGDTGRLPEVLANPAAQVIRSNYSSQFNAGMQNTLAGYADDGVTVHYLDLNLVLDNILADPASYGITRGSAASAYTCPAPTGPTAPNCLADSAGYLFYFDGLHLTSTGFAIVARYVAAQLDAPLMLGGASTVGLDNARQFGRSLTQRLDANPPRDGDMPEGLSLNIAGDGFHSKYDETGERLELRSSGVGLMGSLDYGFGSGMVGVAVRASRQKADYFGDVGRTLGHSIELGGYASFGVAGGFVQGYAGIGRDRLDTERTGVSREVEANPKGHHSLAGIKAGYLMPMAGMRIGPVVGFDWAHAKVKAYAEEGDAALNLGVGSVKAKSLRGSLGIEARGDIDADGAMFRPFASAVLEKQMNDGDRTVYFNQQSAPGIINQWMVEGESKSVYGRLKGGLAAGVTSNLRVDASIEGTLGRDGGNETSGNLAARFAF